MASLSRKSYLQVASTLYLIAAFEVIFGVALLWWLLGQKGYALSISVVARANPRVVASSSWLAPSPSRVQSARLALLLCLVVESDIASLQPSRQLADVVESSRSSLARLPGCLRERRRCSMTVMSSLSRRFSLRAYRWRRVLVVVVILGVAPTKSRGALGASRAIVVGAYPGASASMVGVRRLVSWPLATPKRETVSSGLWALVFVMVLLAHRASIR